MSDILPPPLACTRQSTLLYKKPLLWKKVNVELFPDKLCYNGKELMINEIETVKLSGKIIILNLLDPKANKKFKVESESLASDWAADIRDTISLYSSKASDNDVQPEVVEESDEAESEENPDDADVKVQEKVNMSLK